MGDHAVRFKLAHAPFLVIQANHLRADRAGKRHELRPVLRIEMNQVRFLLRQRHFIQAVRAKNNPAVRRSVLKLQIVRHESSHEQRVLLTLP